jgi:thioredoxin-dependent peroxiredoxin
MGRSVIDKPVSGTSTQQMESIKGVVAGVTVSDSVLIAFNTNPPHAFDDGHGSDGVMALPLCFYVGPSEYGRIHETSTVHRKRRHRFMTELLEGRAVPDFEAAATGDQTIRLSELRGKDVVLYFYPKDNTPGCTLEGQDFRDHFSEFQALNCVVLGVSRDSVRVHENFKAKQQFPFDLLSDRGEKLCELFDVMKMKTLYGKKVRGIERSTFLIDKEGKLAYAWRKVKVKGHVEAVLEKLAELERKCSPDSGDAGAK